MFWMNPSGDYVIGLDATMNDSVTTSGRAKPQSMCRSEEKMSRIFKNIKISK